MLYSNDTKHKTTCANNVQTTPGEVFLTQLKFPALKRHLARNSFTRSFDTQRKLRFHLSMLWELHYLYTIWLSVVC